MTVFWRPVIGGGRGTRPETAHIILEISHIVAVVRRVCLEIGSSNRVKVDAMLRKKAFVFTKAVDEVAFLGFILLSPARRLRRDDAAFDPGLDTVGTWFLFVAANFALLAKDTRVTTGKLVVRIIRTGRVPRRLWVHARREELLPW